MRECEKCVSVILLQYPSILIHLKPPSWEHFKPFICEGFPKCRCFHSQFFMWHLDLFLGNSQPVFSYILTAVLSGLFLCFSSSSDYTKNYNTSNVLLVKILWWINGWISLPTRTKCSSCLALETIEVVAKWWMVCWLKPVEYINEVNCQCHFFRFAPTRCYKIDLLFIRMLVKAWEFGLIFTEWQEKRCTKLQGLYWVHKTI